MEVMSALPVSAGYAAASFPSQRQAANSAFAISAGPALRGARPSVSGEALRGKFAVPFGCSSALGAAATRSSALAAPSFSAATAALTLSSAWFLRGRRRNWHKAGLVVACSASEDAPEEAPPKRRRRRRRRVPVEEEEEEQLELGADFIFKEQRKAGCDCDLILDTVLEIEEILSPQDCERLIGAAKRRALKTGWGEEQHEQYKTDDVKIWNLDSPTCLAIYTSKLVEPMREIIAEHFDLPLKRIQVDDGFIVRYTCEEADAQRSLKYHRDGSIVSAIVTLSPSNEYLGGGTKFGDDKTIYRPGQGGCIIFGGQRMHAGIEITGGTRYICTLFFKCGDLSCRDEALDRDTGGGAQILNMLGLS